jgi:NADH dehydrogenase (ubiquinone) Fe-S protein 2
MHQLQSFNLNFGPQHPAAHGVLRLILTISGEVVLNTEPHIGILHRGTEKLMEYKTLLQNMPYVDRLDYVSMLANEHTYVLCFEKLLHKQPTLQVQYIRVICIELTRLLNHLLAITTHAMDVGAITPFLWAFEEREKLMEFYERLSGARMHANLFRIGGLNNEFLHNTKFLEDLNIFINQFNSRIIELEELITTNRIWINRILNIGIISTIDAINYSFSGILLRSTGCKWDLRKNESYEVYDHLKFRIPISVNGDCYDRYLLRIIEMKESVYLIFQCLQNIFNFPNNNNNNLFTKHQELKQSMETLIEHFKTYTNSNLQNIIGELYTSTEAPKGEFGLYIVQSSLNQIYRCKFRAPGFFHIQGINIMTNHNILADLVTVIGTQDIVFGEIDR